MPDDSTKPTNYPVKELRSGHVRLSIWRNEGERGPYHSVNLVRLYKDEASGTWKRTDSFKEQDLLDIAAVCQRAHQLIRIEERSPEEPVPPKA